MAFPGGECSSTRPLPTQWLEREGAMGNCDTGFERHSARDARFMQFVADEPGIAGFKFEVDPEVDGDEAAQFLAGADRARIEEMDLRNSARHVELSLEALEAESGFEPADHATIEAIEAYEDAEEIYDLPSHLIAQFDESDGDEEDEEGAIVALDPKYLVERPEGIVETFRSAEVETQATAGRRRGVPVHNTAAILRARVEAARIVSKAIVAEEARKAVEAKPEPRKSSGNGGRPTIPPVGKFMTGTVVDQGPKGLMVDIGNGLEARVPISYEHGHGSWDAAAAWVLGFKPGSRVRIKVIRVNGVIEAVLSDRHPRPFWKRGVTAEQEAPAAN